MIDVVAENTDRVNLVIIGLLVVAGLLAMLTIWYWFHTSPRRAVTHVARTAPPTADVDEWLNDRAPHQTSVAVSSQPMVSTHNEATMRTALGDLPPADDGPRTELVSDDEWARLTGPKEQNG